MYIQENNQKLEEEEEEEEEEGIRVLWYNQDACERSD